MKRTFLFFNLVLLTTATVFAQKEARSEFATADTIYTSREVDKTPICLHNSPLRIKIENPETEIEGRVLVKFIVDKDGRARDFKVASGLTTKQDSQAIELCKGLSKWFPGIKDRKPVAVWTVLPVFFLQQSHRSTQHSEVPKTNYTPSPPIDSSAWYPTPPRKEVVNIPYTEVVNGKVIELNTRPTTQAQYPKGRKAMEQFIKKHFAHEGNTDEHIVLRVFVNPKGRVIGVKEVANKNRHPSPSFREEAMRVVGLMPKKRWVPATLNGKKVNGYVTIPFHSARFAKKKEETPQSLPIVDDNPKRSFWERLFDRDTTIYQVVEKMPEFPGGIAEMMKFIQKSIEHPELSHGCEEIQGRVIVQFVVGKNGKLRDFKILRSVHPTLDAKAIQVCKSMPKWSPGVHQGKVVNVTYTIPIQFRLH